MRSLKSVSNIELIESLKKLVHDEQSLTLKILQFIIEVEDRGIYLELAYSTITEYCIHELGYGESSAWRRVRVARVIKEIPEVYDLMVARKLSFSAVLQVASILTPANKARLLPRLILKSKSRIDRIIAEYQQPRRIPDTARPRVVMKEVRRDVLPSGATLKGPRGQGPELGQISLHSEGKNNPIAEDSTPETSVVFEKMFEIRFAADDELMELINFIRSHLSHRFPKGAGFLDIFKYAMNYVKSREDLALQRESNPKNGVTINTRYIPKSVKQSVWKRDKGRCTFVGANDKRCNSDYLIQYDHYPVPFARGGKSTPDNLRLLCAKHNRHTAKKTYGEAAIKRHYIKETRPGYRTGPGGLKGGENRGLSTVGGWP